MNKLYASIIRWLWNKLVVFVFILLILLIGVWLHSASEDIARQWKQLSLVEHNIEESEKELKVLRQNIQQLGAEAHIKAEELGSAEKIASAARRAEQSAWDAYQNKKQQIRFWHLPWAETRKEAELASLYHRSQQEIAIATRKASDQLRKAMENSPWAEQQRAIRAKESEIAGLKADRGILLDSTGKSPTQRIVLAVRDVMPTALLVLAGIILTPVFIKSILYYFVAPWISKTKPVRLMPSSSGEIQVGPSAVSLPVVLAEGDELIVHSDYLQAAGTGSGKKTRWLLSWHFPFTSLAAGLYLLVSVKNRSREESKVTISPKADLFDKICDITLPENTSMVVYPRSLVGLVMRNGRQPRFSRHWRIASLHSWVTFQFRYLVIHGEARILIKGCRGVRAERVEPSKPGMQDQLATLGFSANLAYSGVRCETFLDYLRGRDELFNDRFSDANGFFLTEEVPHPGRKAGLFGRGIEGLFDGFLKAFGI